MFWYPDLSSARALARLYREAPPGLPGLGAGARAGAAGTGPAKGGTAARGARRLHLVPRTGPAPAALEASAP